MTLEPISFAAPRGRPRKNEVVAGFRLRELADNERAAAFKFQSKALPIENYCDVVREMEGGIAYAIGVDQGKSPRSLRIMMNRAAKRLGLKLRWAHVPKDAAEVIVELQP